MKLHGPIQPESERGLTSHFTIQDVPHDVSLFEVQSTQRRHGSSGGVLVWDLDDPTGEFR